MADAVVVAGRADRAVTIAGSKAEPSDGRKASQWRPATGLEERDDGR